MLCEKGAECICEKYRLCQPEQSTQADRFLLDTYHIMLVIDFRQVIHCIMQHQGVAFREVGDLISHISDWFTAVYIVKGAWQP